MALISGKVKLNKLIKELADKIEQSGFWTVTKVPKPLNIRMTNASGTYDDNGFLHKAKLSRSNAAATDADKALIEDITSYAYLYYLPNGAIAPTFTYDFGINRYDNVTENRKVVNMYSLTARQYSNELPRNTYDTQMPSAWKFEGSNDEVSWDILDVVDKQYNFTCREKRFFKFNNTKEYRYYRLTVTEVNGSVAVYPYIGQFDMYNTLDLVNPDNIGGFFMKSTGTSGKDLLCVFIDGMSLNRISGNYLEITIMEDFDANTLKTRNAMTVPYYTSTNGIYTANNTSVVHLIYNLNINADRIFFTTELMTAAYAPGNNFAYVGLPIRVANETDSSAMTISIGFHASTGFPRLLRNRAGIPLSNYTYKYIPLTYSPSVWGDTVFVSPLFLEGTYEGVRGQMDGIFTCHGDNISNRNEIQVGNETYKIVLVSSAGNANLPYKPLLFKK